MEGQESVVEKIEQQRFGDHPDFSIRVSPLDFDPVENVPQWAHQFIGCEVTDEFYKHFTNEKRIFPNLKLMGWTCEFTWDGNDELGDPDEYRYVRYLSVFFSERCRQKVIKSITIQRETLFHTNSNWLDHSESDRWEVIREDTEPQIELYEKLLKSCTKPYLYCRLMDRIVEIALMGRVTFAWDGQIFYGKIDFIRGLPRHVRTSCTFRQLLKIMCHAQTRIEAFSIARRGMSCLWCGATEGGCISDILR